MTELDTAEIRARYQADEDGVYMAIPLLCDRVDSLTEQRDILCRDVASLRAALAAVRRIASGDAHQALLEVLDEAFRG